jgi:hypothetical protein
MEDEANERVNEAVTLHFRNREVLGSNFGRDIDYRD